MDPRHRRKSSADIFGIIRSNTSLRTEENVPTTILTEGLELKIPIPTDLLPFMEECQFKSYVHPVFGIPVAQLVTEDEPVHYFFKLILKNLLTPTALSTVGLFRVPGNKEQIECYKKDLNAGKQVIFDVAFDIAGLLKEFLRLLPEPLIPPFFNGQVPIILAQYKQERNEEHGTTKQLLEDLRGVIFNLPRPNFIVFQILIIILTHVVQNSEINMMNIDNIIKCIAPTVGCFPALFYYPLVNSEFFFGESKPPNTLTRQSRSSMLRSVSSPNLIQSQKGKSENYEEGSEEEDEDEESFVESEEEKGGQV